VRVRRLAPLGLALLISTIMVAAGEVGAAAVSAPPAGSVGVGPAPWSARLAIETVPRAVYGEASFLALLSLRNTGTRAWPAAGPDPVQVAYHWLRLDGSYAVWDGQPTPLAQPVPPGGSTSVSTVVVAPRRPGRYRLQFDLVSRTSGWFSEHGWTAPTTLVTVSSTASRYFSAEVSPIQLPASLGPRSVNVVTVRVTNTGVHQWPSSGPAAVFLSYHWLRLDGSYAVWDGRRTTLTHSVGAAASIVQPLVVQAPSAAGRYALRVDPISMQVGWFSRLGSVATPSSAIEVRDPGRVAAGSESRLHWTLTLAALLTALAVAALIRSKRRRLRGARAIAVPGDAEPTRVPDGPEILTPVTVSSTGTAASRTSGVVTPRPQSTNGSSRGDQAETPSAGEPAAAPAPAELERARPRPNSLADYMRKRGALRDP